MNCARITSGYWSERLDINSDVAIFHQWQQLQVSGCIQNFQIAAGEVEGFREGWFFADSDAYKWLDAASRIFASHPHSNKLEILMQDFINLLSRAQEPDGYLYTYNQIHFPATRWSNLQIEHELYCHGHLIEAGVSHYQATGSSKLLDIACLAADRIVADFSGKGSVHTPGHQEIEIALLRLYQVAQHKPYLDMARQFIEKRGRNPFFPLLILKQNLNVAKRTRIVGQTKEVYLADHQGFEPYQLPPGNEAVKPSNISLRWMINALVGKYFQQHTPIRKQTIPVGHSVRFAYLETAIAMLAHASGDQTLIPTLEKAWEHMVTRRMYVTGGIGSLPALEGFGRDYELDPEYAYTETCAALASMFWNWEMSQLTGEVRYSDLFEWQMYNAASVGMGLDGKTYFYNNPLTCRGGVTRQAWYAVPCCPSNISRTWADLGKYIFTTSGKSLDIHQYISSEFSADLADVVIQSEMPWQGKVRINVASVKQTEDFPINLRIPSWSVAASLICAGEVLQTPVPSNSSSKVASGYDPRQARWFSIQRCWQAGDLIEIDFDMNIQLRKADPRVKGHKEKVAITRGPLVYCLESMDNLDLDIFSVSLDPLTLSYTNKPDVLDGVVVIMAKTTDGIPLTFIPYHLWGNRGESKMTVWVNCKD